jgi:hypothetical protein
MFTPSIAFLVMLNTVAASGAALIALQLSALETRDGLPPSTALPSDDAGIPHASFGQKGMLARAA